MDDEEQRIWEEYAKQQLEFLDYQNRLLYTRFMQGEQEKQREKVLLPLSVKLYRRFIQSRP